MGKGGNASLHKSQPQEGVFSNQLLQERDVKMKQHSKFYWASGDSMEEPHVKR